MRSKRKAYMFTLLFVLMIGLGLLAIYQSRQRSGNGLSVIGISIIVGTILLFRFLDFWGEKLWFDELGYNDRFWTLFLAEAIFVVAGALAGLGVLALLLSKLPKSRYWLKRAAIIIGALLGGGWGFANWSSFLKFWHRVPVGMSDPILSLDAGFYLFTLPFLDGLYNLLFMLTLLAVGVAAAGRYELYQEGRSLKLYESEAARGKAGRQMLFVNAGLLLLVLAGGVYLDRFHLLYSDLGAVSGPGWTDVHIVLPAIMVTLVLTALTGVALFVPALRQQLQRLLYRLGIRKAGDPLYMIGAAGATVALVWLLVLSVLPGAFQSFRVEPNEISYEKPYIANNIEYSRYGYGLHDAESREFPVKDTFDQSIVRDNPTIFNNIRLWDWRALDAVLKQFQEIRLYYEFQDVDIDRYRYDDDFRQVMISAREMNANNLPEESQTFVNKVFKYTHGYGIAQTTVSDFTSEGLPNLLVKNIPPESKYPALEVDQPRIYYGEMTKEYVIVNSSEPEFDYPRGDQNEYYSYSGKGGVALSSAWRKLIYAYKMGDFKLLLTSYPTEESRILFRRNIKSRVKALAPFLHLDQDPYIVNADGQLYWMVDAYTTSSYFPYAEPYDNREVIQYKEGDTQQRLVVNHRSDFAGKNYLRNPVKVTVNAFTGKVNFYTFDEADAILQVWNKILPGMFQPRSEMPQALEAHIRYPVDYLLTQGLVYAKYHMDDPEVFYNQEDLWIRATEKYYGSVQPVEPYYIMWQPPKSKGAGFSLILPFTPKNRQVSIGWIAGLCDPGNYGRFLAYNFPKEKRVLGPQQVETKIDQNSYLSGQLSLWDQRGSRVIRGNVLAIPVAETIVYVEPIYLQAETAAYPELRLVCIMHNDQLSYAETFDEALAGLFGASALAPADTSAAGAGYEPAPSLQAGISRAQNAFQAYREATGAGNFQEAAEALNRLQQALEDLNQQSGNQ